MQDLDFIGADTIENLVVETADDFDTDCGIRCFPCAQRVLGGTHNCPVNRFDDFTRPDRARSSRYRKMSSRSPRARSRYALSCDAEALPKFPDFRVGSIGTATRGVNRGPFVLTQEVDPRATRFNRARHLDEFLLVFLRPTLNSAEDIFRALSHISVYHGDHFAATAVCPKTHPRRA
jgi:hypothetical protein